MRRSKLPWYLIAFLIVYRILDVSKYLLLLPNMNYLKLPSKARCVTCFIIRGTSVTVIRILLLLLLLLLLLPMTLRPAVGFGLSNNTSPFFPIYHQLSPSSYSPSTWRSLSTSSLHPFLGLPLRLVPSSFWVKTFLGILSFSILSRWPRQLILCPFIHFATFSPLFNFSSYRFVLMFHSPSSYLGPYVLIIYYNNIKYTNGQV